MNERINIIKKSSGIQLVINGEEKVNSSASAFRIKKNKINDAIITLDGRQEYVTSMSNVTVQDNSGDAPGTPEQLTPDNWDDLIGKLMGGGGAIDIIDGLTSDRADAALAANQGRVLDEKKVDKEDGKGLSVNDFTDDLKDSVNSAVQGVIVNGTEVPKNAQKKISISVPTKTSEITNDSDFQTGTEVSATVNSVVSAHNTSATSHANLRSRIESLENLGIFVGSHPTFASVPTAETAFPGITVNDFITVRQDETKGGAVTGYIASAITAGVITWTYDVTYSTDITGKADDVPAATIKPQSRTSSGWVDTEATSIDFTEAAARINIATGDSLITMFGKIKKWFADLGSLAWKSKVDYNTDIDNKPTIPAGVAVVDNLSSNSATEALSANQGRELDEKKVDKVEDHSLVADAEIAKLAKLVFVEKTATLPAFTLSGGLYQSILTDADISATSQVIWSPETASDEVAVNAEMLSKGITGTGNITFYARNNPASSIAISYLILKK